MKNIARSDEAVACLSQSEDISAFLTIEARKAFCKLSQIAVYPPAAELFRQGFRAQGIYCIHSGLVKLVNLTPDGKELIVGLRSSGWILGAPAVIIQKPHPVTAVTLMHCHLHYCPGVDFLRFAKFNVEFSKHLLHLYSCEVYDHIRHLVMLGTLTARQRLEQLLLQMISSKSQKEMRLKWPLKLEEIAQLIAVQPEHLSRVLKEMEEEGIIQREKGGIVVSDPQRLFNSNEVSQTRFNERRAC